VSDDDVGVGDIVGDVGFELLLILHVLLVTDLGYVGDKGLDPLKFPDGA
jgi:hypothetical protein